MYRAIRYSDGLKQFLDHARWVAAFAVCAAHLRNLLFPDASDAGHLNAVSKGFYFVTLFGTQAVVVFFVISGLLVGSAALTRVIEGRFVPKEYAVARLTRLYIVLIPAIILSLALQTFGMAVKCSAADNSLTVAGNALFLQNMLVEPICNNHPLWSLSNEAIYYLAAPLIFIAFLKPGPLSVVAAAAVALVAASVSLDLSNLSIAFGALLWAAGLLPLFVRLRVSFLLPFGGFLLVLLASRVNIIASLYLRDVLLALTFALTLSARFPDWKRDGLPAKAGYNLAGFSFSLYLVHMPLAQAIALFVGEQSLLPNDILSYAIYGVSLLVILLIAKLFGLVFERQTDALRDIILRRPAKAEHPTPHHPL